MKAWENMRYGVLIPAYEPEESLVTLVRALTAAGVPVVVVDDGSTTGAEYFETLRVLGTVVLAHETNHGKGRALKTGLEYMWKAGFDGAVTADADGQHTVADILRIGGELETHPGQLILGARDVAQMLPRSKTGNSITRVLFRVLHGVNLQDTQTGLRGIPLDSYTVPGLLTLPGERYEYEMEMLMHSRTLFPAGVTEVPIETIYIDGNASSHFRPIRDGMKIYSVLFGSFFKYLLSSVLSYVVDYSVFSLLYYRVLEQAVPSQVAARLISAVFNFTLNKLYVFKGSGKKYNLLSYTLLAAAVLTVSSAALYILVDWLGLPAYSVKLLVDVLLYIVNYFVQKKLASI